MSFAFRQLRSPKTTISEKDETKSCIYVLYVSTKFPIEEEKMKEKNENKKEENLREYYTR